MKLNNKVAVVTGGSSGIGLAISKEFVKEGASVAIFGRNQDTLTQALRELGERAIAVRGDVGQIKDLERLYRETADTLGKIDIVVANAGIALFTPIDITGEELFDTISHTNFKGAYFTVKMALPHVHKGASIILVSSSANQIGIPEFSVYSATKAAVRSFARTLSAELLPRGIRVNVLSPGPIETPIYGKLGFTEDALKSMAEDIAKENPMKRFGKPEEMAKAALFLASSDSSYMAGAELVADGGVSQI